MLRYLANPATLLGLVLAVAVGLLGHNLSQAWAARALGDHTAVRQGYGRVDRRQLDALGIVATVLTVLAWGFPAAVPVETRFRARRGRTVAALLAGPLFLLALTAVAEALALHSSGRGNEAASAATFCAAGLLITSLFPFPPLALGRALWLYAPTTSSWANARYRLEEDNLGRLIAFALLMLPLVFQAFPDVVGQLVPPLVRHLGSALGGGTPSV